MDASLSLYLGSLWAWLNVSGSRVHMEFYAPAVGFSGGYPHIGLLCSVSQILIWGSCP